MDWSSLHAMEQALHVSFFKFAVLENNIVTGCEGKRL
jgi:hypothetical protein